MGILALDHVNIRTARLGEMVHFYEDVVGLKQGDRPPFPFGGSWLYCGSRAVVHLIEVSDSTPWSGGSLEHFAFEAAGLTAFLKHLETIGARYKVATVPGIGVGQVHLHDPDGNHIHIDFSPEEATASENAR